MTSVVIKISDLILRSTPLRLGKLEAMPLPANAPMSSWSSAACSGAAPRPPAAVTTALTQGLQKALGVLGKEFTPKC